MGAAFDASPNAYVLLRPADLTIVAANQAYLDALSVGRDQIVGKPMFETFDSGSGSEAPENVRQVRTSLERARDMRQRDHLATVRFSVLRPGIDGQAVFEERLWSATHTPVLNPDGEVVLLLQHTTDVTDLEASREGQGVQAGSPHIAVGGQVLKRAQQVQESNRRLEAERNRIVEMIMQAPGFMALLTGPEHRFEIVNDAFHRLVGERDIVGKPIREALPELEDQGFFSNLDTVFTTGEPFEGRQSRIQLQTGPNRLMENLYLNFIYQPIRDSSGAVAAILVQGHDVTDSVRAAERQKLMIDELNHRVKNTLATVQSIAVQTARSHQDPATFAEAFQSRILSLSHTHDLLTRSHWEGADLRAILNHETEAHGVARVSLNGPPVALEPAMALSLGMIFHELATNAAKYGALSHADGRVLVDWSVTDQRDRVLHMSWREVGGPPVAEPDRRGFGSRLIQRNVRHDLAGEIDLVYAPTGLTAELTVPLDGRQTG
ncbi:PAS domain-containing protein [Brevundimonas sp. PAMC22021]|nr:PAS domain-containing protein [Brevundimonas sp. PAMC22021]